VPHHSYERDVFSKHFAFLLQKHWKGSLKSSLQFIVNMQSFKNTKEFNFHVQTQPFMQDFFSFSCTISRKAIQPSGPSCSLLKEVVI